MQMIFSDERNHDRVAREVLELEGSSSKYGFEGRRQKNKSDDWRSGRRILQMQDI